MELNKWLNHELPKIANKLEHINKTHFMIRP